MPITTRESFAGERERFGRRRPFENGELTGLFDLLDRQDPGEARIALSQYVRDKLRNLFPRGSKKIGTVELTNGLTVDVDVGDLFGAEVFVGHCNEAAILDALITSLPEAAKVVDVGANFGIYSLCAAAVAGSGAGGVAFEPAPTAYNLLRGNIERNGFRSTFTARRAAVGAAAGKTQFHVATDESFSGMRDTGRSPIEETIEVDVISLDADEDVKALGAITFLKIDTEGGEAGVIQGAQGLIARSRNLGILLEYSVKNLTSEQAAAMRVALRETMERGLKAWTIDGDSRVASLASVDKLADGFNGSIFLAAREAAWAKAFLAALEAPRFSSSIDATSITAAITGLVLNTRQANQNLGLLQTAAERFELPGEGLLADRFVKRMVRLQSEMESQKAQNLKTIDKLESTVYSLHSQLDAQNATFAKQVVEAQSLRADLELLTEKDKRKNAVIADLNAMIAEKSSQLKTSKVEVISISRLASDLSEEKAKLEVTLSAANEMIGSLKLQVLDLEKQRLDLVWETEQMIALLEQRRALIRHLQQANGLLVLGKRRRISDM